MQRDVDELTNELLKYKPTLCFLMSKGGEIAQTKTMPGILFQILSPLSR